MIFHTLAIQPIDTDAKFILTVLISSLHTQKNLIFLLSLVAFKSCRVNRTHKNTKRHIFDGASKQSVMVINYQETSLKQVWVQSTGKYIFSDNKCYGDHT